MNNFLNNLCKHHQKKSNPKQKKKSFMHRKPGKKERTLGR